MFLQNCGCALARRAMGLGAVLGALALVLPLLVFGLGEGEESEAVLPPEPTPVSSPAPSPAAGWDAAQTVRVFHAQTGGVEEMTMADYLSRVVAAEMPASFQPEALRAQAVCARTYSLWKMRAGSHGADGADLCDDSGCCQAYLAPEEAQQNWGETPRRTGRRSRRRWRTPTARCSPMRGSPSRRCSSPPPPLPRRTPPRCGGPACPIWCRCPAREGEEVPNYHSTVTLTADQVRELAAGQYPQADLSGDPRRVDLRRELQPPPGGWPA